MYVGNDSQTTHTDDTGDDLFIISYPIYVYTRTSASSTCADANLTLGLQDSEWDWQTDVRPDRNA